MNGKIDTNILKSFVVIVGIVGVLGGLYLLQYIYGILLGSVFYAVENGSLTVTTATTTYLTATETSFFSVMGTVRNAITFAAGLIIVGVVLIIFAGFIMDNKGLIGGKKKKGNSDVGY